MKNIQLQKKILLRNARIMEVYANYDTDYEELIALNDTRLHILGFFQLVLKA